MDLTRDAVDGLTRTLGLIDTQPEIMCVSVFSDPWSLAFSEPAAHLHVVESGSFLLISDGIPDQRLGPGDIVMIRPGIRYALTSRAGMDAVPLPDALGRRASFDHHHFEYGGGGAQTHLTCARFRITGPNAVRFIGVLPNVMRVGADESAGFTWLRSTVRQLQAEVHDPQAGTPLIVEQLVHLLFIQFVRAWARVAPENRDALVPVADDAISKALKALHAEPGRAWSVEALAAIAGISRSAFAARFTTHVGEPPLRYLTHIRLRQAAEALRARDGSIGEIASRFGYGSEAAFSRAFKASFGITPAAMRRAAA